MTAHDRTIAMIALPDFEKNCFALAFAHVKALWAFNVISF
jgi:hypothetical protein